MNSSDAIYGVGATQVIVPPGATNAQFIDVVSREVGIVFKYFTGGTLEIQTAVNGTTMSGASLAGLLGTGYILGTAEVMSIDGPCRFYLMATGTTATAHVLRGLSNPGYNSFGVA